MLALPCARCGAPLTLLPSPLGGAFGCSVCKGVWLDLVACHQVAHSEVPPSVVAALEAHAAGDRAPALDAHPFRSAPRNEPRCPMCHEPLAHSVVAGVSLDVCPRHGAWFDEGEVRTLVQGLAFQRAFAQEEAARRAELEARWAETERDRARVIARQREQAEAAQRAAAADMDFAAMLTLFDD